MGCRRVRSGSELLGVLLEGRYRIDAIIARGGMSTVYRGVDLRLDRPVAVKVMDPRFADDPAFLSRFELEARSVARLSHAGLVAVYDQGRDDGHVFLVMELVEGGTLRDLLRERRALSVPLAFSVLEPVLAALATAHRAGLVHRDIKPENVLIAADGLVKIADFGLVRAVAAAGVTAGSVILGTAAYLSPEQVSPGSSDARSDVYSAGVLLYEMLTGVPPYSGESPLSVAYQHVNTDTTAPSRLVPGLVPELDDLVLRATRRDPAARFTDAGQMLGEVLELRRWLHLAPVRVPVPGRCGDRPDAARTSTGAPTGVAQHTRAMSTELVGSRAAPPAEQLGGGYAEVRRRARRSAAIWITVVLLLAAAVGLGGWWLGSGQFTSVPVLTGLPRSTAEQLLARAGLQAAATQEGYDNSAPPQQVLGAQPAGGSRVTRGATVRLRVSLGRPVVPRIAVGTPESGVTPALQARSLRPVNAPGVYDETAPEGTLVGLTPAPGTALDVGSPVQVQLSLGPPPRPVPTVVGRTVADATATLVQAGLQVGRSKQVFSPAAVGGTVVSTSPPAAAFVRPGAVVELQVSDAVTVPGLRGHTVGAARSQLAALGLQVDVRQLIPFDNSLVVGQNVDAGARVRPDATVVLTALP